MRQNLVRFAADHESRYPAPAVRGHEDYVAASFRRGLDNFLPRMVTDLVDPVVAEPRLLGGLLYHRQALICDGLRIFGVGVLGVLELRYVSREDVERLGYSKPADFRVDLFGEFTPFLMAASDRTEPSVGRRMCLNIFASFLVRS